MLSRELGKDFKKSLLYYNTRYRRKWVWELRMLEENPFISLSKIIIITNKFHLLWSFSFYLFSIAFQISTKL